MADLTKAFEVVLKYEGAFNNQPTNRDGKTMYSISQPQYPDIDIAILPNKRLA